MLFTKSGMINIFKIVPPQRSLHIQLKEKLHDSKVFKNLTMLFSSNFTNYQALEKISNEADIVIPCSNYCLSIM